jgi:alpha-L-fucosidase
MNRKPLTLIVFLCVLLVITATAQPAGNTEKAIFYQITDSGRVFANPPFQSCHAATIAETGKDTLLYAWFGGDHEGADNVAIWGCFRYLKTNQWSGVQQLASGQNAEGKALPCWNPVLFKTAGGIVFLDYKAGPNPREWWAERKISYDHGKTWSAATRLPQPFLGPIKNKPLQLNNGTILYASSTESPDEKSWKIHLETSNASGDQWQYLPISCDSFDVIQPSILKYGNDSLQMVCRSKQNSIVQTWSFNNGKNWSALTRLKLPNPNAGIDAVSLYDGWQLLVYNPMQPGKDWWVGRSVLKVALSKNGIDWKDILTLEDHASGEYSYPAVIQDSNRVIHIAYTDDRKNIRFVDLKRSVRE